MDKINAELRKQITEIVHQEIDNPAMDFLSITKVKTTRDLQESRVYFSILDENRYEEAQKALDAMKGLIRGMLGKRVRLRNLPQLNFFPDESIKYSVDIYQKIEEIKNSSKNHASQTADEDNSQDKPE